MIVSKTGMERMPERCEKCEMGIVCGNEVGCPRTGTTVKRTDPRPPDCPLVEVEQIVPNWPLLLGRIANVLEEIRDRLPEKRHDDGQA